VALQIPGAVLVERWSARKMISATMISWGLNTIASQFQDRVAEYGIMLQRASTDREGGWQLIYRMLKSGELVICGDTCPELVKAIPTRLHDLKKPGDIIKTPGDHHDDEVDAFRYAIYSFVTASDVHKPVEIRLAEAMQKYDATTLAMKHYQIIREAQSEQQPTLYSRNALTSFGKSRGTAGDSRTTETK
jgi:hypothetical protein